MDRRSSTAAPPRGPALLTTLRDHPTNAVANDPVDELWPHHVAANAVIGGKSLGWYYTAEAASKQPFLMRHMVKPDKVWIQSMARRVGETETVTQCWRRVLAWPCRTLMTYHDVPTSAFVGDGRAALTEAVRASGQLPAG